MKGVFTRWLYSRFNVYSTRRSPYRRWSVYSPPTRCSSRFLCSLDEPLVSPCLEEDSIQSYLFRWILDDPCCFIWLLSRWCPSKHLYLCLSRCSPWSMLCSAHFSFLWPNLLLSLVDSSKSLRCLATVSLSL